jgi:uncharacterized glyoxalase superfamily protein PhnB
VSRAASSAGKVERAEPESFRARDLAVSLTVKEIEKSLAWYRDVLGFIVGEKHEREGRLRFVSLKAGAVKVLLAQDDGAKGLDRKKGEGFSMQFTTAQDIDELAKRIKAHGTGLASEPEDRWGARAFRVRDPDGFMLVFSSERVAG